VALPEGDNDSGSAETPEDFGDDAAGLVKRYLTEIRVYDRGVKDWQEKVKKIVERYRNTRVSQDLTARRKYALLWSTIQTQTPALFARVPVPVVERRWKDAEDVIASTAAEVLDRALTYTLEMGQFKPAVDGSVFDYQIAGRGVVWLRKEVDHGDPIENDEGEANDPESEEEVVREVLNERIAVDEVPYSDFGHNLGRNWKEVHLVWRRIYMSREQLRARFKGKTKDGQPIADQVELDHMPVEVTKDQETPLPPHLYKLATVYELWDKTTKEAIWVAVGYKDAPLDRQADPLGLTDFFPCPRPIWSSLDTTSLIPMPDYCQWEDQAREVDDLTQRIHRLIGAARVRGGYDATIPELAQLFEESIELDFIPINKWMEFASKGGLKGSMDFIPLENFITALSQLYEAREQAKRDASEINGVGDIIRGQNAGPEKTATESRISGQFGTLRLQDRQKEIQRFCRDIIRMMGEMIAEGFLPETLQQMTGIVLPTALEKQMAQGLVDQDKAYQAWKSQQGQAGPASNAGPSNGPSTAPPTPSPAAAAGSMPQAA